MYHFIPNQCLGNRLYAVTAKFMSGTLFMKHSCPLPKTADACFLVDIHLKHWIRCPRVFCIYKVQGSRIYYVRYLTLLKNNYFILQKPLSLLWHPEPLRLKIIQNKTQSPQKQNRSNCSIRSLSNPVSNAWESKTAPQVHFLILTQGVSPVAALLQHQHDELPHCSQYKGRRENPYCNRI